MQKCIKGSLAVYNVRKIADMDNPLFLTLLSFLSFFYSRMFFFFPQPLKTPCFTPLKQTLDTLSKSAEVLETAFRLLVDLVKEQRELNT